MGQLWQDTGNTLFLVADILLFFFQSKQLDKKRKKKLNKYQNKKHSENADTSTSVTFDLVVWPWPFVKVKKADVIRCAIIVLHLSTRYDVYGFNTLRDITICLFDLTIDFHLWPSAFVKVTWT